MGGRGCTEAGGQRRHQQGGHDEQQQRRVQARFLGIEALGAVPQPTCHEGAPEDQDGVAEHRSDQGGLDHAGQALVEGEQGDEQLGRLPSVDCRRPVALGPRRSPTCSMA